MVQLGVTISMCCLLQIASSVYHIPDSYFAIDEQDGKLLVPDLIRKYGYEVERHEVKSDDGYFLSLMKIVAKRDRPQSTPVMLVHGLFASSADFLIVGPNNSLAYLLADNGYDVWLPDMRGNRYSRRHESLNINYDEYWNFSWHEMGYYDIPAVIDYVLAYTGAQKLVYIGHSQGSTVFFVMATTRPEYNDKIALAYVLAPAVFLNRLPSPILRMTVKHSELLEKVYNGLGIYDSLPHTEHQYEIFRAICPGSESMNLCVYLMGQIVGPNPQALDKLAFSVYFGHFPSGVALKQLQHFSQIVLSGRFARYDYGSHMNMILYNQTMPPSYPLSKVMAPVIVLYGQNDYVVHPRDIIEFSQRLPNLVGIEAIEDKLFCHMDFTIAKNVRTMVYDKLINTLHQYGL